MVWGLSSSSSRTADDSSNIQYVALFAAVMNWAFK